jgi:hypothetical protein
VRYSDDVIERQRRAVDQQHWRDPIIAASRSPVLRGRAVLRSCGTEGLQHCRTAGLWHCGTVPTPCGTINRFDHAKEPRSDGCAVGR